ncbi:hypothetical protein WJX82_000062 [Trebouxia sp. C0006]
MPALHLLHRRPRTSLARARVVCISRVVLEGKIPSSLAAIPARTAVVESSRLERMEEFLITALHHLVQLALLTWRHKPTFTNHRLTLLSFGTVRPARWVWSIPALLVVQLHIHQEAAMIKGL